MDNKKYAIVGGGVLLVIVAFMGLSMMNSGDATPENVTDSTMKTEAVAQPEQKENTETSFVKGETTFKGLLTSIIPQQCSFTSVSAEVKSAGKVYFSGGKMRGDFSSDTAVGAVGSHMIVSDKMSYIWSDNEKMGMKIPLDETNTTGTESSKGSSSGIEEKVNVDCSAWIPDASKFVPPADVTFNDMNAMMEQMMQGMGEMETGALPR